MKMPNKVFASVEIGVMDISGLKAIKPEYPLYIDGKEIGAVQLMIEGMKKEGRQSVKALMMVDEKEMENLPQFFKVEPNNYSISYGKMENIHSFSLNDIENENLSYIPQVICDGNKR